MSHAAVTSEHQDVYPADRYKNIHRGLGAEVKTIHRPLVCWLLWAQGWCTSGCSVTRTEAPGAGAGGGPGRVRWQTVPSPYSSHPVLGLTLLQGEDVPTLSQPLRLLS